MSELGSQEGYSGGLSPANRRANEEILRQLRKVKLVTAGDGTIRLTDTADVTLTSTDHSFQIGEYSAPNLAMDSNEVMARNNGGTATLYLNNNGGQVVIGSGGVYSGGSLIMATSQVIESQGAWLGDRIKLYNQGTSYTLGIASGTLYYNSDGTHEFRVGGSGRAFITTNQVGSNGNSIRIGAWDSNSSWTGSVQGSCGYLLIGYSGGVQNPIYLRSHNASQPVYIGAGGQNALTVGTVDLTVTSSTWTGYQFRSTYTSSNTSYTTANAFLGNGGNQAVMSLWSANVASQFRMGANAQIVYHRIWDDSAYSTFNSIVNNFSSVHAKQNIETWPVKGASVGAAANSLAFPSALETAMALRPVKYQWKPNVLLARAPSDRRAEAVVRLNEIREGKGQPKWQEENPEEFIHNCQERPEECSPGPNGECLVMRDWEEGQVGFIAQEVAEVLPQAAKLDVKSGEYELLDGVALSAVAIGAIQELKAQIDALQARIEVLEAK